MRPGNLSGARPVWDVRRVAGSEPSTEDSLCPLYCNGWGLARVVDVVVLVARGRRGSGRSGCWVVGVGTLVSVAARGQAGGGR
ncbi:hypothetical protein GCM10022220_52570 [Actinocatenispora rupis]|uniref:Uncharacterized protein n=1 Tax=Actinocatenispora rupis TaxID=519421 RepID=A0A8J3NE35_9ACTN|nr:hypothetical protein Aru02nite_45460 [Actinocatenispora rupis]